MKLFLSAAIVLGLAALAVTVSISVAPAQAAVAAEDLPLPTGHYIEARDATVWGGACHISGQADSAGAHLIQAWSFDDGVRAVLVTEGTANLDAHRVFHGGEAAPRRAIFIVDGESTQVRERVAGLLGLDQAQALAGAELRQQPILFRRDGDEFAVRVAGVLELEGQALADRACCTMPESRWYNPLSTLSDSVVGFPEECHFAGDPRAGLVAWTYTGENSVYVGRF